MMYLDAKGQPSEYTGRIARWLEANGCRDYISVDHPIIIRGKVAEYHAICRKWKFGNRWDGKPGGINIKKTVHYEQVDDNHMQAHVDANIMTTPRKLRISIPLHEIE